MTNKYLRYGIVVGIVVFAMIWSCRNQSETVAKPGVSLLRIGYFTLDPNFQDFMTEAAEAYHRLHPDVEIKQLRVPRQVYRQWQRTQIVGEMAPEIMQFSFIDEGVEEMVLNRFVILDSWVRKPNPYREGEEIAWKDSFHDTLGSRDSYNAQIRAYFGIPFVMGGYRLIYNESLREELGMPVAPWNYQEFQQMADRLKGELEADGIVHPVKLMVGSDFSSYVLFRKLFTSVTQPLIFELDRDGDMVVNDWETAFGFLEKKWSYETAEVKAGLRLIHDSAKLMNAGFAEIKNQDGVVQFVQQRGMALGSGHLAMSYLPEIAPFKVKATSFPVPDKSDPVYGRYVLGPVTEVHGTSTATFGVMRSPVQHQAIDFLRFLTGTKMTALLRVKTSWRLAVKEPEEEKKSDLKSGYPDTLYDMMNGISNVMSFRQNSHLIFKSEDGPEHFARKMADESPPEMITWLGAQAKGLQLSLKQQEAALLARWVIDREDGEEEASAQSLAEIFDANNRREAEYLRIMRFLSQQKTSR